MLVVSSESVMVQFASPRSDRGMQSLARAERTFFPARFTSFVTNFDPSNCSSCRGCRPTSARINLFLAWCAFLVILNCLWWWCGLFCRVTTFLIQTANWPLLNVLFEYWGWVVGFHPGPGHPFPISHALDLERGHHH